MDAFRNGIADVRSAVQHASIRICKARKPRSQSVPTMSIVPDQRIARPSPAIDCGIPLLHPKEGQLRHSPVAGVILTNGEVDAVAGLLSMREGSPFTVYAHPRVLTILKSNNIFNVLSEPT